MNAIISDIHGNLEALDAVLADAKSCGASNIYCLGDIVGYGPNSIQCVERAMSWPIVLMGNFEQAAATNSDLEGWTAHAARKTVYRFRESLTQNPSVRNFLSGLSDSFRDNGVLYVHGTARHPIYEYLYPEDILQRQKMSEIAECFDRLCFCGHTHLPGIFFRGETDDWKFVTPEQCNHEYEITGRKTICNVGSVGQPRDSDPRACYVLHDETKISFRRVSYDVEQTIAKIKNDDDFDDFLGDRLRSGR